MAGPRLRVRGLTLMFGRDAGVDLDVAAGEIHALAGLNGAGKTTLMRLVLGMLRRARGASTSTAVRSPGHAGSGWGTWWRPRRCTGSWTAGRT